MSWYIHLRIRIRVLGGILGVQFLLSFAFAFAFTNRWLCLLHSALKILDTPFRALAESRVFDLY